MGQLRRRLHAGEAPLERLEPLRRPAHDVAREALRIAVAPRLLLLERRQRRGMRGVLPDVVGMLVALGTGLAPREPPPRRMADRHQPQPVEAERLQLLLIRPQQVDHVFRFTPAGIKRYPLPANRFRPVGEKTDDHREHPLVTEFDERRPARQYRQFQRRLVPAAGRGHDVELRILFRQRLRLLRPGPGEQDLVVAACLGQFGRDLRQRRRGGRKLNVGRLDAIDLPVAQHARDPDLQAARFHHAIRRGDPGIETQQADVRAHEGRRLVAHGRHAGHEFLGRKTQVAGTKPHRGILHRP